MAALTHTQAHAYIQSAADQRLSAATAQDLNEHLRGCRECRQYGAELANVADALPRAWRERWGASANPSAAVLGSILHAWQPRPVARAGGLGFGFNRLGIVAGLLSLLVVTGAAAMTIQSQPGGFGTLFGAAGEPSVTATHKFEASATATGCHEACGDHTPEASATHCAEACPTHAPEASPTPCAHECASPEASATHHAEASATASNTHAPEASATHHPEASATPSNTHAPEATRTPSPTSELEASHTPESTQTASETHVPEATWTPGPTHEPEHTAAPSSTHAPEATQTPGPTHEPEHTATPGSTQHEPTATNTHSPEPTATNTHVHEPTVTNTLCPSRRPPIRMCQSRRPPIRMCLNRRPPAPMRPSRPRQRLNPTSTNDTHPTGFWPPFQPIG